MSGVWRVAAIVISAGALNSAALGQSFLNVEEVRALITGNTVDTERTNGTKFRAFFEQTGRWFQEENGLVREGAWDVKADGSQCILTGGRSFCAFIQKNDDGTWTRIEGGKPQFRWTRISKGGGF